MRTNAATCNIGYPSLPFEEELLAYQRLLPALLPNAGSYAVIHRSDFLGAFSSYEGALIAGFDRYGLEPFLVRRISADEGTSRCPWMDANRA